MGANTFNASEAPAIIDAEGYRHNVGIVLMNAEGMLFFAKRLQLSAWQFPQGGIQQDETPNQALGRELKEEVGLSLNDIEVISVMPGWVKYDLPEKYRRQADKPFCVGQIQKWFLLKILCDDDKINLNGTDNPEFETWSWVNYWYPISQVVRFKEAVYRQVLYSFATNVYTYFSDP